MTLNDPQSNTLLILTQDPALAQRRRRQLQRVDGPILSDQQL